MGMAPQTAITARQRPGVGPSASAARRGRDRKTVRKDRTPADASPKPPPIRAPRPSKRDPDHAVIQPWRADDARPFYQPPHTAQRVRERRQAAYPDFAGASSRVPRSVNRRRTPAAPTGPLARVGHPGACPGDVGTADAVLDDGPPTGTYLPVRGPSSHAGDRPRFGGETAAGRLTGLPAVFARLGGVPPRLIFDHAAAGGRTGAGDVRLPALFQRCPAHDGCTVTRCHPTSGDATGPGDNTVGYLRRPRLVPRPPVVDLPAVNPELLARCEADGARAHYTQHPPMAVLLADDRAALGPWPRARLDPVRSGPVQTDGYGTFGGEGAPDDATAPE
jgi:hypothetical protein